VTSVEDVIALVVAIGLAGYLLVALLFPERF
jgi:K+-transporting ATPase KdpF subunit